MSLYNPLSFLRNPRPARTASPDQLGVGYRGGKLIRDASAHTGRWGIIQALEDTVIADVRSETFLDGNNLQFAGYTLKQGIAIYGEFTKVQLTSGSVAVYTV